jgi:hypothetical protein
MDKPADLVSDPIEVVFRIFPGHVEVDVLRSGQQVGTAVGVDALASLLGSDARAADQPARRHEAGQDEPGDIAFADWMAAVLRREGLTMEAAARQLGVSARTVSRWVGGTTEPRLRDLRRIRELFGDFPLP